MGCLGIGDVEGSWGSECPTAPGCLPVGLGWDLGSGGEFRVFWGSGGGVMGLGSRGVWGIGVGLGALGYLGAFGGSLSCLLEGGGVTH